MGRISLLFPLFNKGKLDVESDSHQTASSANESLSVYIGPEVIEIHAPCGLFRSARGSGERDQSCKSPIRPIPLCSEEIRCHERVASDRALTFSVR